MTRLLEHLSAEEQGRLSRVLQGEPSEEVNPKDARVRFYYLGRVDIHKSEAEESQSRAEELRRR